MNARPIVLRSLGASLLALALALGTACSSGASTATSGSTSGATSGVTSGATSGATTMSSATGIGGAAGHGGGQAGGHAGSGPGAGGQGGAQHGGGGGGAGGGAGGTGGAGGNPLAVLCGQTFGQVTSQSCCAAAGDFPGTCGIGACSCPPQSSHTVQYCSCPAASCFDPQLGCVALGMTGGSGGGGGGGAGPVCTPGMDQTCNDNLAMQSFAGKCQPNGTCTCSPGFSKKPSGKCG